MKKLFKKHYKKIVSTIFIFTAFVVSAYSVLAYSVPTVGYPPLDYFTQFLPNGNPDFYMNNVPGSWYEPDSSGRYRYWVGGYFSETSGDGLPSKIQGYVCTYNYTTTTPYTEKNVEGYYNARFVTAKYGNNVNKVKQPDYVMFRIADDTYSIMTDWYICNRRVDTTFYWTNWYADNIFIPRFVDEWQGETQLRVQVAYCFNTPRTRQDIGYLTFWYDYFNISNNPIDIPEEPLPTPPQEEETFPGTFENSDISNTQDLENEVLNSQGVNLDKGLSIIGNARNTISGLASSFVFISDFMNNLVKDNPFATLITVSISLGIFGFLLNAFISVDSRHRSVKARNEKSYKSSGKWS